MTKEIANIQQLEMAEETLSIALASKDYYHYTKVTNRGYKDNDFGEHLCNKVQDFIESETKLGAYQVLIVVAPPQHGKACEDNTTVLTTKGWKRHGDLVVGDYVYGMDGFPKLITHTQTSYLHDCVEVTFDSGDSFICAKEHEWVVECNRGRTVDGKRGQRQTEILEAQHIFDGYHAKSPAIKVTMPLQNEELDLPIDPYLLGLWLGDGNSKAISITSHIDDFEEITERLIKRGHIVKTRNNSSNNKLISVGVTNRKRGSNYFLNELKANNLIQNKHIPPVYINASYKQRVDLLKGLMDTDGSVTKNGCICEYSGINKTLVLHVYELVRSLGIKCSFMIGDAKLNGRVISKKYRVQFTPNKEQLIFGLARKQNRINAKTKTDRNDKNLFFIKSVKECGQHNVKCITVDGGIYLVGNGFIPTHNSFNVTATLPSWTLGKYPDKKIMIVSYNDTFAKQFGRDNMIKVFDWGKKIFDIELNQKTTCISTDFEILKNRGSIKSRGITSGIVGNPCDLFVIDDPIRSSEEADSENQRAKVWSVWQKEIKSRLSAHAKVIIILTRWHEDDIAGRILAYENLFGNVEVLKYACECEQTDEDPLGRAVGEPLSPELGKDKEWVNAIKQAYLNDPTMGGRRTWDALYQGRPAALEGNIVLTSWLRFWKPRGITLPVIKLALGDGEYCEVEAEDLPDTWDSQIQSWDCAFKGKKGSDPVAGGVFGRKEANYYLLDADHRLMEFTETITAIENMTRRYPNAIAKYIEAKANGDAVISSLRRQISGLIPVEANDDKVARLRAVSPVFQSGNFFLPHPHLFKWVMELIKELQDFPNGANDDYVDMISQALNKLMYQTHSTSTEKIPKGLWAYPVLLDMGFSKMAIKSAWRSGEVRLLLVPIEWKR